MDINAIDVILKSQETSFRTLISHAVDSIDGDKLAAMISVYHVNLRIIASKRFPASVASIDDPFEYGSDASVSPSPSRKKRGRLVRGRKPGTAVRSQTSAPAQMTAVPAPKKTTNGHMRILEERGANSLFGANGKKPGAEVIAQRNPRGIFQEKEKDSILCIDLSFDSDDSAGSAPEDNDQIYASPPKSSSKRSPLASSSSSSSKPKHFASREEKEAERRRGRHQGLGGANRDPTPEIVDSESESEARSRKRRRSGSGSPGIFVDQNHSLSPRGESGRVDAEMVEGARAGFAGEKNGENDAEMEDEIRFAEEEEDKQMMEKDMIQELDQPAEPDAMTKEIMEAMDHDGVQREIPSRKPQRQPTEQEVAAMELMKSIETDEVQKRILRKRPGQSD